MTTEGSTVVRRRIFCGEARMSFVSCGIVVSSHFRSVEPLRQKASKYQVSKYCPGTCGPERRSMLLVHPMVRGSAANTPAAVTKAMRRVLNIRTSCLLNQNLAFAASDFADGPSFEPRCFDGAQDGGSILGGGEYRHAD